MGAFFVFRTLTKKIWRGFELFYKHNAVRLVVRVAFPEPLQKENNLIPVKGGVGYQPLLQKRAGGKGQDRTACRGCPRSVGAFRRLYK